MFSKRFIFFFLTIINSLLSAAIYDCFPFLNEFEVLEIRLNELYDYVDKFVLIEATETFTGRPKPLYFEENKERFAKYLDKIIHVKVEGHYETNSYWARADFQRNHLMLALEGCHPNDMIIFSDVDEMPPCGHMVLLDHTFKECQKKMIRWRQNFYRFYINRQVPANAGKWYGSIAIRYADLLKTTPSDLRNHIAHPHVCHPVLGSTHIWEGGWHFSMVASYEQYREKIYSYCGYTGVDPHSATTIREQADTHILRKIDESYPKCVVENPQYYIDIGLIDPYER